MAFLSSKKSSVTLLARQVIFDSSNEQNPILIEGDRKGFVVWVLKKLHLADPSFRLEVQGGVIETCSGKKEFTFLPLSLLSSYSVGYSTKKRLIVQAITFALAFVLLLLLSIEEHEGVFYLMTFLSGISSVLSYWLYKRSGAFQLTMNLYNGEGAVAIRVASGITGNKLEGDVLQKAIDATKIASSNSSHFR